MSIEWWNPETKLINEEYHKLNWNQTKKNHAANPLFFTRLEQSYHFLCHMAFAVFQCLLSSNIFSQITYLILVLLTFVVHVICWFNFIILSIFPYFKEYEAKLIYLKN